MHACSAKCTHGKIGKRWRSLQKAWWSQTSIYGGESTSKYTQDVVENFINSFPNHQPFNTLFSQDTVPVHVSGPIAVEAFPPMFACPPNSPLRRYFPLTWQTTLKPEKQVAWNNGTRCFLGISLLMEVETGCLQDNCFLYNRAIFRWPMIMGGRVGLIAGTFPRLQDRNLSSTQLSACASDAAEKVCAWDTVRTMLKSSLNRETPVWCRDRYIPPQKLTASHG